MAQFKRKLFAFCWILFIQFVLTQVLGMLVLSCWGALSRWPSRTHASGMQACTRRLSSSQAQTFRSGSSIHSWLATWWRQRASRRYLLRHGMNVCFHSGNLPTTHLLLQSSKSSAGSSWNCLPHSAIEWACSCVRYTVDCASLQNLHLNRTDLYSAYCDPPTKAEEVCSLTND